jgi:nitrate reductase cytochrome c-type subunit
MRVGVAESSPPNAKDSSRFHPPKSIWSDPPRRPGHHSFEAERNLNQCVSCHTERDCVVCHGALGVGGGFDPHQNGFVNGCGTQFRRNPRPCLVCHEPTDRDLSRCK